LRLALRKQADGPARMQVICDYVGYRTVQNCSMSRQKCIGLIPGRNGPNEASSQNPALAESRSKQLKQASLFNRKDEAAS